MKSFTFTLILICVYGIALSQDPVTDSLSKAEVSKLDFITGEWHGTGWMMGRDGTKHSFEQQEKVQYKLDGTAILIEGLGKSEGKVIHNALAIITSTKEPGKYNFQSYLANGRGGSFKSEVNDNVFYWYINDNMRYIIKINDQGQWFEIGEMKQGDDWFQFFEMTLDKKKI